MAVLPIRLWPDPVLSVPCAPVGLPGPEVLRLAEDMLETMYAAPGRGLAAPQVGVSLRLFVMDAGWRDGSPDPLVLIDPEILWKSDALSVGPEGCLSIPGVTTTVERARSIRLRWREPLGALREELLTGFAAICAQHECDHLDGIVTLDRLSPAARTQVLAAYAAGQADP